MLCRIIYPDSGSDPDKVTTLYYDQYGQISMIEDPGGERTTFGYTDGLLSSVQDSVANDWRLANPTAPTTLELATEIVYHDGRVQTVTLPAADGKTTTPRPSKTYLNEPATVPGPVAGETTVAVAGLPGVTAVTYDAGWKQLRTTSPMGVWAETHWHEGKDLVLWRTNSLGLRSTSVYDPVTDRVTDIYGPAPDECFTGNVLVNDPVATVDCGIDPAHSSTVYDTGLQGLKAAYYPNLTLSGQPTRFSLGLEGATGGVVDRNWGTGAPASGMSVDDWSVRLTGLITFPNAGTYYLRLVNDDYARVYIDDVLNVAPTYQAAPHTTNGTAITVGAGGKTSRIRVEYQDDAGAAALQLAWTTGSQTNGPYTVVPGTALRPDYGLVSSTVSDDGTMAGAVSAATPSTKVAFSYTHPWLGQATTSTVDPDGPLQLSTSLAFEAPYGAGWLRRLQRTLPGAAGVAGDAAKTVSTYFGDLEYAPNQCGVGATTRQYGMLKSIAGPDPAGTDARITTEYVYDVMGRVVGTKTTGDAGWSCTTYDNRGRVITQTITGLSGTTPRTVQTVYSTAEDPGAQVAVSDNAVAGSLNGSTVTSVVDVLGRSVSYTDVWDTVTTPQYDPQTGRVNEVHTSVPGGTLPATAAPNEAPTAGFTATSAGLAVTFDAAPSTDVDGTITGWAWDFGDTATATGATPAHTYAAAGEYTVRLTVTDDDGDTSTTTRTLTLPGGPGVVAADSFTRTVPIGWGTADVGGTWNLLYSTPSSALSVSSGTGYVSGAAGETRMAGLGPATVNAQVSTRFTLTATPADGALYAGTTMRSQGWPCLLPQGWFRDNAKIVTVVTRCDGSTLATYTHPGVTWSSGDEFVLRAETIGQNPTVVRAKMWRVGDPEPSAWQIDLPDSTANIQGAGVAGFRFYRSGSATASAAVRFDDFQLIDLDSTVAPVTSPDAGFVTTTDSLEVDATATAVAGASYAWDWGDGATSTGATPSHTYELTGTYPVTLTVTGSNGKVSTLTRTVVVTREGVAVTGFRYDDDGKSPRRPSTGWSRRASATTHCSSWRVSSTGAGTR